MCSKVLLFGKKKCKLSFPFKVTFSKSNISVPSAQTLYMDQEKRCQNYHREFAVPKVLQLNIHSTGVMGLAIYPLTHISLKHVIKFKGNNVMCL